MPLYGFQYEVDDGPGELGTGLHEDKFQSVHDKAARRCFNRRVRNIRAATRTRRKRDRLNLVGYLRLIRIHRNGYVTRVISREAP